MGTKASAAPREGALQRRKVDRVHADQDLIDLDVLTAWMDGQGLPPGPIENVEQLPGGTQNALVGFTRGGERYVLRRGPRHLRKSSNEVIRREMRVLEALSGTDVPHPRFIAGCPDESVMKGATFYLMEWVDGYNATVGLPAAQTDDPTFLHEMGLQVAESIAKLGAVAYDEVGLDDFGQPDGFLERQIPRWRAELDSYRELDGYPGPEIPALDKVADWLDDHRPDSFQPGIMHGDYHLANVLFHPTEPRLAAIVDWEMCTVGDPLLDLGWLLATWPTGEQPTASLVSGQLGALDGLPTPAELIERYTEHSERDSTAVDWYTVLACFKLGIVLEGTHARACAGKADPATGDLLHSITLGLFARAEAIVTG